MYSIMSKDWLCCAYLRKSREDEERDKSGKSKEELTKETLDRHKRMIEVLARENNHAISHWYTEVVSGETIDAREQIKLLLASLADGQWDAVYAVEASRLGRGGGGDQEKIVNAFRYTDTWLITEEKNYDPSSKSDMKQLKNDLRGAEDELDSITTRLIRGRIRSAQEGRWQATGRAPYGWRAVRIGGVWQLEPDENHGVMLRIYDLLESGAGCQGVADMLNAEGIATPRGADRWMSDAIRTIAKNEANCGYTAYGKRETKRVFDPETFQVRKTSVKNDKPTVLVKGLHFGKGGISEERFERITGMISDKTRTRSSYELKNPLAGLLRCGKCGYALLYQTENHGHPIYCHRYRSTMRRECPGCHSARVKSVIESLVSALLDVCADIEIRLTAQDQTSEYETHIEALGTAMKKAVESRKRAMEAYEAGAYTIEELKGRKAEADKRIAEIEKAMEDAKPPEYSPETVTNLQKCIELLRDESVSPQAKNDFLKTVIRRIDYYSDTAPRLLDNRIRLDIFLK